MSGIRTRIRNAGGMPYKIPGTNRILKPGEWVEGNPPNLEDLVERRNDIYLKAKAVTHENGVKCWTELGVANRHLEQVQSGQLTLEQVRQEIYDCLDRCEREFGGDVKIL